MITSSYVVRGENGFFVLDGRCAADADRASRFRYLSQAKQVVDALNRSGTSGGGWGVWELQPETTPIADRCTGLTLRVVSNVVKDSVSSFGETWNRERSATTNQRVSAAAGRVNATAALVAGENGSDQTFGATYAVLGTEYAVRGNH